MMCSVFVLLRFLYIPSSILFLPYLTFSIILVIVVSVTFTLPTVVVTC